MLQKIIKNSIFKSFKTNDPNNLYIYKIRYIDNKLYLCNFDNKNKEEIKSYFSFKDNNIKIKTSKYYYILECFISIRTYKKNIKRKYMDKVNPKYWMKRIKENNEKDIKFNRNNLNKISEYNNALYIV